MHQELDLSFIDIWTYGDPNAVSDQTYKLNLSTQFVGPDLSINPVLVTYDQYLKYQSNIATSFINDPILGSLDQELDLSFIDIWTYGDPNAVSDQTYKLNLSTQFVGPDLSINIIEVQYLQYLKYKENITSSFIGYIDGGIDTGVFDQNLVFSSSTFATYFK